MNRWHKNQGLREHDTRQSIEGISLVEVVLAVCLVTIFCASALTAFLMNQVYSSLSIYNSQANRINQNIAETILSTNYESLTSMVFTNYDFSLTVNAGDPELAGKSGGGAEKSFRARYGSGEWTTNLAATVAFESVVDVRSLGSYSEADIRTYWYYNGRYMTNSLTVARADDR